MSHGLFRPTEDCSDLLGLGQVNERNYIIHALVFMNMEFLCKVYQSLHIMYYRNKNCNVVIVLWKDVVYNTHDSSSEARKTRHRLHWTTKILSHEEKCLFLMYFWELISHTFPEFLYYRHLSLSDSESSDEDVGQVNKNMNFDPTFAGACSSSEPHLLTQGDLNEIVRDLKLSKKQDEVLGPRLK